MEAFYFQNSVWKSVNIIEPFRVLFEWMFPCLHQMTPKDLADERGHVNIKTFLEEERSPEKIGEFPRNISMMDVSVLLAVHLYC